MNPPLKILYEDNHLLVVEKPVNVPSQADSSGDPDLLTLLKKDLKERYQKPGNVYLGLVHRLDRPVGGVMVFAKTSKAAARLSEQIKAKREFIKIYRAVIFGTMEQPSGTLRHFLLKTPEENIVNVVSKTEPGAKEAILDFQVMDTKGGLSLVQINLQTGRSHQIRVQFAAAGRPLYGDQKYGAGKSKPGEQLALWATELQFPHPTKNEPVYFRSTPPAVYPWNLFA
ncbi:MAG TPA: RluA family pseudouridine synthase [Bacillota bacterium]|nr:RluA family pseudouridine synthase [Bacillota bacterium]